MTCDWAKVLPQNKKNTKQKLRVDVRQETRVPEPGPKRGEGGPALGGSGGSDRKGGKFGGSEEKRGLYTQTWWVGGLSDI